MVLQDFSLRSMINPCSMFMAEVALVRPICFCLLGWASVQVRWPKGFSILV